MRQHVPRPPPRVQRPEKKPSSLAPVEPGAKREMSQQFGELSANRAKVYATQLASREHSAAHASSSANRVGSGALPLIPMDAGVAKGASAAPGIADQVHGLSPSKRCICVARCGFVAYQGTELSGGSKRVRARCGPAWKYGGSGATTPEHWFQNPAARPAGAHSRVGGGEGGKGCQPATE